MNLSVCCQKLLRLRSVERVSLHAVAESVSVLTNAAISSMTVRTTAPMRSTATRKVSLFFCVRFRFFFVKTRRLRYPECVSVLLCVSEQIRVWMNAITTAVCVEMKVIVWWTEPTRSAPADPASRKHTCKPAQVPVQHTHTHGTGAN